jgi:hypothetical protein
LIYQLNKPPVFAAYCHCTECRQRNSSPCTGFVMGLYDSMVLSGQSDQYSEPGGSGAPLEHHRCTNCGTVMYSRIHRLKNIVGIPASTLENPEVFKPVAHLWTQSKVPWFDINDALPQFKGPPKLPAEFLN